MTDTNLLSPEQLQQLQAGSGDVFDEIAKGGNFLKRMQFFSPKTQQVAEGKIAMNHFGLVVQKDKLKDLGDSVDVIPLAWRACAIRLDKANNNVLSYFDHASEDFQKVVAESEVQDSGCFYGPQFLLWLPSEKSFASFMFGNKSSRPEAQNMRPLIGKPATLKWRVAKNKRFTWTVPTVIECST